MINNSKKFIIKVQFILEVTDLIFNDVFLKSNQINLYCEVKLY